MQIDLKNLPADTELLHRMIRDLLEDNLFLKEQLALLRAQRFGSSSEKLNAKIDQQIEALEQAIEEGEARKSKENPEVIASENTSEEASNSSATPKKNQPKRKPLPAHLPREEINLPHEESCGSCGGGSFRTIEDDVSEVLEYTPASFKVLRYVRPRAACSDCETIVQAYPPSLPISKGLAGPGLLAHILVQKYADHLPFYRQSQIFAREDLDLSRSTMAAWAGRCAAVLMPLIGELRKNIFASDHLHGDDTTVAVLEPGAGKTKTGRIWAYVRDGSGHDSNAPPAACYFYSPDRKAIRPEEHLKTFTGTLHADAYSGFNGLYEADAAGKTNITAAACWAHVRRKFHDIAVANPHNANTAYEALERIRCFYEVEEEMRHSPPEIRLKKRGEKTAEKVNEFFIWLKKTQKDLPRKGLTSLAINYALKLEEKLKTFLKDGAVEIDNNIAERALRGIAIGRKNWLFAGSDHGGETTAAFLSLIETAKLNHINPWKYLNHLLNHLQDHNSQKLNELLPWNLPNLKTKK
jgi:transposase